MVPRIHITGGPGTGKTTLGEFLGRELGLPVHDLDGLALARIADADDSAEANEIVPRLQTEAESIAASHSWVSEGAYITWTESLFQRAEVVVWLDVDWRVAVFRIIRRHFLAELSRSNRFPGWRKLLSFSLFARRYYANANDDQEPNEWGSPGTRLALEGFLEAYSGKVQTCSTRHDVIALTGRMKN